MDPFRSSDHKRKMETMDTSDIEAEVPRMGRYDGLIYHDCVPELVNLAAFRLTLDSWLASLQDPLDDLKNTFDNRIDVLSKELASKISQSAINKIIWYSKRILKLSSIWVSYHQKRVFQNYDTELVRGMCLPTLKWRSNGSIDSLGSSEALLNSAMLSDEQEYKLVCWYCMENRIVEMWSRMADDQCVFLDPFFDSDDTLVSHWNNRRLGFSSESGLKSFENRLVTNEIVDNLSAAVYFFDRFKSEERVEKGCQLIPCVKLDERAEFVRTMISKFDNEELRRAFQFYCSDIMYPLIMNPVYYNYAIALWDHIKNTLTIQSFLGIMIRITATIRIAFKNPHQRFVDELDTYDDFKRHIFSIVGDLWQITPSSLRKHDLTSSVRGVIFKLAYYFVNMNIDNDPEARFLLRIFPDADIRVSRQFLNKHSLKLAKLCGARLVRDLVKVTNSHIDSYQAMSYEKIKHLIEMFRDKKFDELEECLQVCAPSRISSRLPRASVIDEFSEPLDSFSYPYELNDEEVDQLRKFLIKTMDHNLYEKYGFLNIFYSYCPRLWPEPFGEDWNEAKCYVGLNSS